MVAALDAGGDGSTAVVFQSDGKIVTAGSVIHNNFVVAFVTARFNPDGSLGPPATIYNPYQSDPATGLRQPFPNNQIPLGPTTLCAPRPACVDPVTLAYLKYVLTPNTVVNGIPMLAGAAKTMIDSDQGTARLDFNKGAKAHFYGRFTEERRPALGGGLQPLQGTNNASSSRNIVVHWTESISANSVNDFLVSYSRPKWILGRNFSVPDVSTRRASRAVRKSRLADMTWEVHCSTS